MHYFVDVSFISWRILVHEVYHFAGEEKIRSQEFFFNALSCLLMQFAESPNLDASLSSPAVCHYDVEMYAVSSFGNDHNAPDLLFPVEPSS